MSGILFSVRKIDMLTRGCFRARSVDALDTDGGPAAERGWTEERLYSPYASSMDWAVDEEALRLGLVSRRRAHGDGAFVAGEDAEVGSLFVDGKGPLAPLGSAGGKRGLSAVFEDGLQLLAGVL